MRLPVTPHTLDTRDSGAAPQGQLSPPWPAARRRHGDGAGAVLRRGARRRVPRRRHGGAELPPAVRGQFAGGRARRTSAAAPSSTATTSTTTRAPTPAASVTRARRTPSARSPTPRATSATRRRPDQRGRPGRPHAHRARGDRVDVRRRDRGPSTAPTTTVLALAIDTDDDPRTGGGTWGDLGVRSAGWDQLSRLRPRRPATNTIRGLASAARARRWRVQAVTADASTGTVMNVAFRGVDEQARYKPTTRNPSPTAVRPGPWFEDKQAAALATGDVSAVRLHVATADLRPASRGGTRVGPGLHERVYTSEYTLAAGEGMTLRRASPAAATAAAARRWLRAGVQLPRPLPALRHLRPGRSRARTACRWSSTAPTRSSSAQINQPGMQQRFGEELNRILVVPEARGPDGYGSDISERDLLDVMADVETHLRRRPRPRLLGRATRRAATSPTAWRCSTRTASPAPSTGSAFTGDDANGTPAPGQASSPRARSAT